MTSEEFKHMVDVHHDSPTRLGHFVRHAEALRLALLDLVSAGETWEWLNGKEVPFAVARELDEARKLVLDGT